MVPEYWLTEGGQSATGALLDHIIENHAASTHLANRAASKSESFCSNYYNKCYIDVNGVNSLTTNSS